VFLANYVLETRWSIFAVKRYLHKTAPVSSSTATESIPRIRQSRHLNLISPFLTTKTLLHSKNRKELRYLPDVGGSVLIVLDNFRVGGIQRLALDQLYVLRDLGIPAEAHYRQVGTTLSLPNFLSLEESRINESGIKINGLPKSNWSQLLHFVDLFRKNNFSTIVNHSVGSAVILKTAILLSGKQVLLKTYVHQLPTLSATIQRLKRFVYSLFSDEIYGYSVAVTNDWNHRITNRFLPNFIRRKLRMKTQRNGIYLDRLPSISKNKSYLDDNRRLVFIGRSVGWKNIEKLFSLMRLSTLSSFEFVIIVPTISEQLKQSAQTEFGQRIFFEIGKKIEDIEFRPGDIHIYPVDYGPGAKFVEAISLNCLEMACLGIPSIIAENGSDTWPDLIELGFFHEVNWNDEEEVILGIETLRKRVFSEELNSRARILISIEKNIKEILSSNTISLRK